MPLGSLRNDNPLINHEVKEDKNLDKTLTPLSFLEEATAEKRHTIPLKPFEDN